MDILGRETDQWTYPAVGGGNGVDLVGDVDRSRNLNFYQLGLEFRESSGSGVSDAVCCQLPRGRDKHGDVFAESHLQG